MRPITRAVVAVAACAAAALGMAGSASAITGNQPIAVVLCKFEDSTNEPHDVQYYRDMFSESGAGKQGAYDYWKDVSYGQLDLTGTAVKGWYTVPMKLAEWQKLGRRDKVDKCASQADADLDFDKFAGVAILTNQTGLQEDLFGGGPPTTINGASYAGLGLMLAEEDQQFNGILHESAHLLRLDHSRTLSQQPNLDDYGDPFDIGSCLGCRGTHSPWGLNNRGGPGVNAVQLDTAGWLAADRKTDFDTGSCHQRTLRLASLNHPEAAGFLAAHIPAAIPIKKIGTSTTTDHYAVEFREQSGWDAGILEDTVLLHLHGADDYSYWVDASGLPSAGTYYGTGNTLHAGDEYVDAGNSAYVAVNRIDVPAHLATLTLGSCKIDAAFSYSGDTSGTYGHEVTLAGDLVVEGTTAPIPDAPVSFTLGEQGCAARTDANGHAACRIRLDQVGGVHAVQAAYAGEAAYDAETSAQGSFVIQRAATTTAYTGATVLLQGGPGATLQGRLVDDGGVPLERRTLTLAVGEERCDGTTDASGIASCVVTVGGAPGPQQIGARFAGDAYYLPSSGTAAEAIVFAFPDRGAFVLGDKSVGAAGPGTPVTWWGDTWSSLNKLSGGRAPLAFKGFAGTTALPTSTPPAACGGGWSTTTGNSPPPAAGVPSYMGVLVADSVRQSGSTVSGNTARIVVVKVAPGYAPDPARHGTGTIVATYCQ